MHELALAYYGLAVALDRDEQPVAAREAMLRALAHDPTPAVLKVAATPGGDFFFVPDGDVFYYLGLAAEAEGRDGDAEAAFREFIARAPREPLGARRRGAPRQESRGARRRGRGAGGAAPRVIAHGTVLATGGIAAPLVDAAWRDQLPILDECLDGVRLRAARDAAHRDRDGRRRARKLDARHRQGARAVRRTVCALRGIGDQGAAAVFGVPRRGGRRWRAPRWSSACPRRSPRARSRCSQDRRQAGYTGKVVSQREAALHRRRRADRRGQEQPRRDPGRRSCPRG